MSWQAVDGSFRDPSGFVFTRNGILFRQINTGFQQQFDAFLGSGLFEELTRDGVLIPHEPASVEEAATGDAYAVIRPERVPFVSYPYEWCFGQLKDAALLTLNVQERALRRGFVLRDASAYNVQFLRGRAILIDTLSFEPNVEGRPWFAYRQFCEHFLVPLLLMSRIDIRFGTMLRDHLDGVPLDLGSALLPFRSWANPWLLLHVHLHARAQKKFENSEVAAVARGRGVSTKALIGLTASLRSAIESLDWAPEGTTWSDYASHDGYSDQAARSKEQAVADFLGRVPSATVWDAGANTGQYSRLAAARASLVVSLDVDPAAVERNYRGARAAGDTRILPLCMDLMNPSPAQGWAHRERLSLEERGPADVVLALALVHHLAIARNVPLPRIAEQLSRLGRALVVEFVPKQDARVVRLLRNRPDIFPGYTKDGFESAFGSYFTICDASDVKDSERKIYLMTKREAVTAKSRA